MPAAWWPAYVLTCMLSACCSQWVLCRDSYHELSGVICVAIRLSSCLWPMCLRGGGHVGCWHCAGCVVLRLRCLGLWGGGGGGGFKLGCQSVWRPRCNRCGVALDVGDTLLLLLCCGCVFLGSLCGARARSSSCLAAEVQSCWCCQYG